jgi:periplasmic divalent cation tolerance protein
MLMKRKKDAWLIISTVPDRDAAKKIADTLVNEHLAACVNIMPPGDSIYPWKGKICCDKEHVIFIKTTGTLVSEAFTRIKQIHSYEVPELIAVQIGAVSDDYWAWMQAWLKTK